MWGKWSSRKLYYFIWHGSLVWPRKISICPGNKRNQNTLNENHAVGVMKSGYTDEEKDPNFGIREICIQSQEPTLNKCWDLTKFSPLNESLDLQWQNGDQRSPSRGLAEDSAGDGDSMMMHLQECSADSKGSINCSCFYVLSCAWLSGESVSRE